MPAPATDPEIDLGSTLFTGHEVRIALADLYGYVENENPTLDHCHKAGLNKEILTRMLTALKLLETN